MLFSPKRRQKEGVQLLIERYHKAGINNISHNFYPGGRHEMLNEINREEVQAHLPAWISAEFNQLSPPTAEAGCGPHWEVD